MYFSISAPQNVTIPDGSILAFRVNAQDSSLCEMHIAGPASKDDKTPGTHVLTFKRNGGPQDTSFTPVATPPEQPAYKDPKAVEAKKQVDLEVKRQQEQKPVPPPTDGMYGSNRASVDDTRSY